MLSVPLALGESITAMPWPALPGLVFCENADFLELDDFAGGLCSACPYFDDEVPTLLLFVLILPLSLEGLDLLRSNMFAAIRRSSETSFIDVPCTSSFRRVLAPDI